MTDRVQLQSVASFDTQQVQRDDLTAEHGIYQGQQAQTAPDAQSLIQDSAEELTFGMAEVVEKKVTTRKMGKKGELDQRLIDMLRKLEQVIPEMNRSEKMSRFMTQLMKMLKDGGQPGSNALRQLARQFFEDPTEQYAALDLAREWSEGEEGGEPLAKAAAEALKELDQEAGPAIRAGFNISCTAAEMAQGGLSDI